MPSEEQDLRIRQFEAGLKAATDSAGEGELVRSRFQFGDDHRDAFEVKRLCEVLEVNRSSYYKWLAGREARTARQWADQRLAGRIREVHAESGGAYGSPKVTAELRETGLHVNEKRGARVMRSFHASLIRETFQGAGDYATPPTAGTRFSPG
ncbi:IS3 family transposase [Streptomyces sp. CoH17]|uniref:IS3 family transposase n=1 Tax=Streptomyces sp. CoH17 TaxID=2992806 RepID=UPI002270BBB6|nr:IS3 family transposase [Streptomyces sp. CoH17]